MKKARQWIEESDANISGIEHEIESIQLDAYRAGLESAKKIPLSLISKEQIGKAIDYYLERLTKLPPE